MAIYQFRNFRLLKEIMHRNELRRIKKKYTQAITERGRERKDHVFGKEVNEIRLKCISFRFNWLGLTEKNLIF